MSDVPNREDLIRRAKAAGGLSVVIGVSLILLSHLYVFFRFQSMADVETLIGLDPSMVATLVQVGFTATVGVFLTLGGLQFRRLEEKGRRRLVSACRWALGAILLATLLYLFFPIPEVDPGTEEFVTGKSGGDSSIFFWSSALLYAWIAVSAHRYFTDPSTVDLCRN